MTPRHIADSYHVTPQITPEDIPAVVAQGFRTVICNRPDAENPPSLAIAEMQKAVEAAGLRFEALPFDQRTLTLEIVAAQRDLIESVEAPVLAYCASGNRCTVIWALGEAARGTRDAEAITAAATQAGYDVRGLRGMLDGLIAER